MDASRPLLAYVIPMTLASSPASADGTPVPVRGSVVRPDYAQLLP